jgi:hypothetical protein
MPRKKYTKRKATQKKVTRVKKSRRRTAESATSGRRSKARTQEDKAFDLRILGNSYREIGRQLGVSGAAAHKMVKRVLEDLAQSTTDKAIELRRIETRRIEAMLKNMLPKAMKGKQEINMKAVDRVVKLMDRMAKLWGLDAPVKVDATVSHEDWLKKMEETE